MDDELGENYLAHYGVKGMKWGQRKQEDKGHASSKKESAKARLMSLSKQKISSFKKKRAQKKSDSELKKAEKQAKKEKESISDLSDQELRNRINRLEMEKKYAQLTMTPKEKRKAEMRKLIAENGAKATAEVVKSLGNLTIKLVEKRSQETKELIKKQKIKRLMKKYENLEYKDFNAYMKKAEKIIDYDEYQS